MYSLIVQYFFITNNMSVNILFTCVICLHTVFPRIDARAFISFATPRIRRLNEAGVYFTSRISCHAHPRYVAHAEVEIHFSSCDRMAIKGVTCTGTLSSLLLEVHLEASLLCHRRSSRWNSAIPFESTARCTWTTCHAPKLVPGRPGVYSRPGVYLLYCP